MTFARSRIITKSIGIVSAVLLACFLLGLNFLEGLFPEIVSPSSFAFGNMTASSRRIRRGEHQEIETLINEEALLFAKYLRDERETWIPRIAVL